MEDKRLFNQVVDQLNLLITKLNSRQTETYFNDRNGLRLFLFDGHDLLPNYRNYIPIDVIGPFEQKLRNVVLDSMFSGDQIPNHVRTYTECRDIIIKYCKLDNVKVFYSWQSDLPSNTNRNFIQEAINDAIKTLNSEQNANFYFDSDTRGASGSPDIVTTILSKIDSTDIFICDVTPIIKNGTDEIPNPNVLFELGYAIRSIGDSKIIMLLNSEFGNVSNLPFDLGLKRQMIYACGESDGEKSKKRKQLGKALYKAIKTITVWI